MMTLLSWMRVAVYSGRMGAERFTLRISCRQMLTHRTADQDGNTATLCWAAFPGNQSTLTMRTSAQYSSLLWDVYPDKSR
jgi:hypothetical protein